MCLVEELHEDRLYSGTEMLCICWFIYILEGKDIYCSSELESPKSILIFSFILSHVYKDY